MNACALKTVTCYFYITLLNEELFALIVETSPEVNFTYTCPCIVSDDTVYVEGFTLLFINTSVSLSVSNLNFLDEILSIFSVNAVRHF